jgi:hypothetical protein
MPDLITGRDPIVVHFYIPTHPRRNEEYTLVLQNLESAYRDLITIVDACEASGEFDFSIIEEAKEKCKSWEKRKDEIYTIQFG